MKFSLNDFMELDVSGLLSINGGGGCSSSSGSRSSGGSSSGRSGSSGWSSSSYHGGSSGGGGCSSSYRRTSLGGNCSSGFSGSSYGGGCSTSRNYQAAAASGRCTIPVASGNCSVSDYYNGKSNYNKGYEDYKKSKVYQTPDNPDDYHCDINSFNVAVDQGIKNPGTWDGNKLSVNEIYAKYYGNGSESPEKGTQGYGFYSNDGGKTYSHMFYYQYDGGDSYHVWNSDGKTPVTENDWSMKGTAIEKSVFVPLY